MPEKTSSMYTRDFHVCSNDGTYRQKRVCAVVQDAREELEHPLDKPHRLPKRIRDPDDVSSILRKRSAKLGRYLHQAVSMNCIVR